MTEESKINIAGLENRLIEAERKENKIAAAAGILNFITGAAAVVLLVSLNELIWHLNTTGRTITAIVSILFLLALIIYFVAIPFIYKRNRFTPKDHISEAEKTGRRFGIVKDDLKNVLQIVYGTHSGYSDELINAALNKAVLDYSALDFTEAVSTAPLKNKMPLKLSVIILCLLLFISRQPLQSALIRIINFSSDYSIPPRYSFSIKPGDYTITRGDDVEILVDVNDRSLKEISTFIKTDADAEFHEKRINNSADGLFHSKEVNVQNSFSYFAAAGDVKSRIYSVAVVGRPVVREFELKIIPPAYSNLQTESVNDNGNVTALFGTKVIFNINSSKDLKSAFIQFGDSTETVLKTEGKKAWGEARVKKNVTYHFKLTDEENNSNVNPVEYEIKSIADAYPTAQILSPENNFNIRTARSINIVSRISDDYGFLKMNLNFRISESKYEKPKENYSLIQIPIKNNLKEEEVYYTWDVSKLYLAEGEAVSYYIEIFDNDNISGPKSAKSDIFILRVPTVDDLFKAGDKEEQNLEKDLKEVLDESKKLKEEFDKNVNELKKNKKELSWEEKNNISQNLENLEKIENKIDKIKETLASMQKEMSRDNLLSKETMDKYAELQKILNELNNDEFKQALQKLQEALKSMMRDNAQQSLNNVKQDEEFLKNSIERTLNLLKRIKVEQKIDELLKRAQNLNEKTSELTKKMENSNLNDPDARNELQSRQKDITEGLKQLDDEMKKTDGLMKNMEDMPEEEMKKLISEFQKQKNDEISKNAESAIQQSQKENAMRNDQSLSKNLSSSSSMISSMKTGFMKKNQMKSFREMMKSMENLIALSKEQEKLRTELENLQFNSEKFKEKLHPQNELKNNLSKIIQQISDLSQKTLGITPEMGKALGKAMFNMQNAITALQGGSGAVIQNQRAAMEGLNQAASLFKGSMDKMMSGGSGGSMMSLMQQMQQLSMQQMNLNKLTQQLNKGMLSMEEQAQLQRLAGQQEMIRKSLEKLNREAKEAGQSKSLAGSLDKTLEEIQSVVKELSGGRLDNNVVQQQERILSRMLDSQRSLNEKDYEKNRESKSGGQFEQSSPDPLNLKANSGNKLRDELLKTVKEGYKKDYEELIKRYFEALEKQGKGKG